MTSFKPDNINPNNNSQEDAYRKMLLEYRNIFQTEQEKDLWDNFIQGKPLTSEEEERIVKNKAITSDHLAFASGRLGRESFEGRDKSLQDAKSRYLSLLSELKNFLENDPDHSDFMVKILDEVGYDRNEEFMKTMDLGVTEMRDRLNHIQQILDDDIKTPLSAMGKAEDEFLLERVVNISSRIGKLNEGLNLIEGEGLDKEKIERINQRLQKIKSVRLSIRDDEVQDRKVE